MSIEYSGSASEHDPEKPTQQENKKEKSNVPEAGNINYLYQQSSESSNQSNLNLAEDPSVENEGGGFGSENQEERGYRDEEYNEEEYESEYPMMSEENTGKLQRLSEGGKQIASSLYEGLYKLPVISRVVGKIEIAYNQFWKIRHEKKAVKFKTEMDQMDMRDKALAQSQQQIEAMIKELQEQGLPGSESLQLKIQEIDRQRNQLLTKRDRIQSKFEARENKTKTYTNERNKIADRLIERYEGKLEPMEKELEQLSVYRDEAELQMAVLEAEHKDEKMRLDKIEKQKSKHEEMLRTAGFSENEIRKFDSIVALEDQLATGYEQMKTDKKALSGQMDKLNKRIAKQDAKANPFRDKREEFVRIKSDKPLEIAVPKREKSENPSDTESTEEHNRMESSTSENEPEKESTSSNESVEYEEKDTRLSVSTLVSSWNQHLMEEFKDSLTPQDTLEQTDFVKTTKLSPDKKLDSADFKKIVTKYYKLKRKPIDKLKKSIDKFAGKLEQKSS